MNSFLEICSVLKIEEFENMNQKVDLIIGDIFGFGCINSEYLINLIDLRDRFLKSEGNVMPSNFQLKMVGISDHEYFEDLYKFWEDVYGFKMT